MLYAGPNSLGVLPVIEALNVPRLNLHLESLYLVTEEVSSHERVLYVM